MTPIRIAPDSTSRSVYVRILRDTGFANTTPLVFNSAGLAASYVRDNGAAVAIPLVTLSGPTAAYASGGFVHVSNGVYRLDLPNAALVAGASFVSIIIAEATDIRAEALLVDLDAATGTRVQSGELVPADLQSIFGDYDGAAGLYVAALAYYTGGAFRASLASADASVVNAIAAAVESHLIDEADGQTILNAITAAIGNTNVNEVTLVAAIKLALQEPGSSLATLLARITAARAEKIDNLDATVSGVPAATWGHAGGRTLTSFGTLVSDIVTAVTNASMTLAELTTSIGAYVERVGGMLASLVYTGGIPQGTGDIVVNHDTGGADNLALKTSGGAGVDDARITAYVESEYAAGGRVPRDTSRTDPTGRWRTDMHLAAGTYRFVFDRAGHPSVSVTQVVE